MIEQEDGRLQAVVLDGHGKQGHLVSEALMEALPELLASEALCEAFLQGDERLRPLPGARVSGAACIAALVACGDCWQVEVACAGDCRAWLALRSADGWRGSEILAPSSCERERQRLEAAGGSVRQGVLWAGPIGVAMSRALGDHALRPFGLLAEPELSQRQGSLEAYLLLVTDGVSDVLTCEQCAQELGKQARRPKGPWKC